MLKFTKNIAIPVLTAAVLLCRMGAQAAVFTVMGPCSEKPLFQSDFSLNASSVSAGELSERIFRENGLPFEGGADGFTSIMGSPSGMAAVEVVSPEKMRFYGWCFSVDGVLPQVTPDVFNLGGTTTSLVWFYAFSTYEKGAWTDSCVPSYTVKAAQFCAHSQAAAGLKAGGIPSPGRAMPASPAYAGLEAAWAAALWPLRRP